MMIKRALSDSSYIGRIACAAVISLSLLLLPITSLANQCTTNGVTWTYVLNDGKAKITAYDGYGIGIGYWGEHRKIVLPSTVDGHIVNELGDGLFEGLYLGDMDDWYIRNLEIVVEAKLDRIGCNSFSNFETGWDCPCEEVRIVFEQDVGVVDDDAFSRIDYESFFCGYVVIEFKGNVGAISSSAFANNIFENDEYYSCGCHADLIVPDRMAHEFRRRLGRCCPSVTITERSTTYPVIVSTKMRASDPTIMDIRFRIVSPCEYVKVRALVFENGERNWSHVVRPVTYVEGTEQFIGDHVRANEDHILSWRVTADWQIELAKAKIEILTMAPDMDLLPMTFITIPANGDKRMMKVAWNRITGDQLQNALYWLYASGDQGLHLENGNLKNGTLSYVLSKMGLSELQNSSSELEYAARMTRLNNLGQAYRWID